jgi:hypothetical protein
VAAAAVGKTLPSSPPPSPELQKEETSKERVRKNENILIYFVYLCAS